ncbi:hypothetical protein GF336_02820 [Candidatus Woesearchaeota archaeon]|nr:hypothetical protein [Candidatus Woesearchaeota archaeon]
MKFSITRDVFSKFPKLCVGVVVARGINNKGSEDKIYKLMKEVEDYIKLSFVPAKLSHYDMMSPWRTAFEEFGTKPETYPSSVESLMKKILHGRCIRKINKLVDISNYISLKHLVPAGVYNLDEADVFIKLAEADGTEQFFPIGSVDMEHPERGEIVYKDDNQILCRKWNWKESEKTKVTEDTSDAIFFIDGLPPVKKEKVKEITEETAELVGMFCSGKTESYVLDIGNDKIEF